jgi:tetratricopeptide (TPR) repeat protein
MHRTIIILFLISLFGVGLCPATGEEIPMAQRMVLYNAQKKMDKSNIDAAILMLIQLKAEERLKGENKGNNIHHLVDFTLGNCFLLQGKNKKATDAYLAAVNKNPDFSMGWLNLAKAAYDMEAYTHAGNYFFKGYETSQEKNAETLYYSAAAHMAAGNFIKALNAFKGLMSNHPSEIKTEWKETLVHIHLGLKKPSDALLVMMELARETTGKKQRQWREALLHQYMALGMNEKALAWAIWLINDNPVEPKWWQALAHLHLNENRHEEALVAMTLYSHLVPLTTTESILLADLNLHAGIPAQAVKLYEKTLNDNTDMDSIKKLVHGYRAIHRPEAALLWAEKGLEKSNDLDLLTTKGDLLYEMTRYDDAADAFETVADKNKSPGRAWLMAGYAAWNAGDIDRALRDLKKAAGFDSHKKNANLAMSQLYQMEKVVSP